MFQDNPSTTYIRVNQQEAKRGRELADRDFLERFGPGLVPAPCHVHAEDVRFYKGYVTISAGAYDYLAAYPDNIAVFYVSDPLRGTTRLVGWLWHREVRSRGQESLNGKYTRIREDNLRQFDGNRLPRCRDQKWRPVEPGTFPLAHGSANRVGRLRGYGNALCAPQAEAFIRAYREIRRVADGQ